MPSPNDNKVEAAQPGPADTSSWTSYLDGDTALVLRHVGKFQLDHARRLLIADNDLVVSALFEVGAAEPTAPGAARELVELAFKTGAWRWSSATGEVLPLPP